MAPPLHKAIQSPQAFSDAVDAYITACLAKDDQGKDSDIISLAGFALSIDCHSDMLTRWREKYGDEDNPHAHDPACLIGRAIKRLVDSGDMQLQRMAVKDRNAMALALGKIKNGWIEQQHVKVEGKITGSISVVTGVPNPTESVE